MEELCENIGGGNKITNTSQELNYGMYFEFNDK